MADQPVFDLAPGWRLAYDDLQWIAQRYRSPKWRAVHFIATKKAGLMRVLREEKVELTPESCRALDHLPDTFREWHQQLSKGSAKLGRAAE